VIVGLISGTLMGVVDTVMIAPLGTDALAAIGLATSALIIVYSGLFGLLSVVTVAMAQAHGAKDHRALGAHLTSGLVLAVLAALTVAGAMVLAFPGFSRLTSSLAVLNALLPYWCAVAAMTVPYALFGVFRGLYNAMDQPWIVVWIGLAGVAINVPLNWLLIYGAGLGLLGAGVASLIAKSAALLITIWHWRHAPSMAAHRQPARLEWADMLRHVKEGVPVSLGSLGEGSTYAATGLMMALFGAAALAANQVVHSIGAIIYMVPMGMTAAVAIRMGQAVGAREVSRYRPIFLAANSIVLAWAALVFTPLLLFRHDIAGALSTDLEVIVLAVPMFVTMAFIQFADGLQSIALGALRGQTDNRIPNAITISVYWAFALPLAYAVGFVLDLGPNGVLAGYAIGVLTSALILQARFWWRTRTV
jgi:MATE family multidrug resistance protein